MASSHIGTSPSARPRRSLLGKTYSVLEDAITQKAFPGAAFGVLAAGEICALDAVGRFIYDSASPQVSAVTIYDLASVTKVLATTSMAMLLYDRSRLPLDAPVARWLPGLLDHEPAGGPRGRITIRMLLAHSSGLPAYERFYETSRDPEALLTACLRLPLEAPPGERYAYSDPGFILLGKLLEKIAAEPMDSFCAREVFGPLGMTSTCYRPPENWRASIPPTELDRGFRRRIIQGEVQDENCAVLGGVSGHAGLFSNALDPLRYAASLLGHPIAGMPPIPEIFRPATVRLFTTRQQIPPGSSRALGWDTPSEPSSSGHLFGRHSAGHLGYAGTSLWIDFDAAIAIVLLTNRTWPDRSNKRIQQVRPLFHDTVRRALQ